MVQRINWTWKLRVKASALIDGRTGDDGADADGEDTGESNAEVSWCWLRKQGDTSIDEEHANVCLWK